MKRTVLCTAALATMGLLVMGLAGCDSDSAVSNSPSTQPSPFAAYQPSSGQNLSPGIAPYAHGDPEWPMDAGRSGGGGRR